MCPETTYRTYGAETSSCYRHVAPLEQKYASDLLPDGHDELIFYIKFALT